MTIATSGNAFLTAAAIFASSWLMMRAISRADFVSKPTEVGFEFSVAISLGVSVGFKAGLNATGCSSIVTVAMGISAAVYFFNAKFLVTLGQPFRLPKYGRQLPDQTSAKSEHTLGFSQTEQQMQTAQGIDERVRQKVMPGSEHLFTR